MKVSVAMATYNGEKYIEEQLDSIRNQTHSVDEVVICDDCSTDKTVEVVNRFICEHQLEANWRIEVNEHNLGYASNFIEAVHKTTGDYIFFCDQDDIWVPDRVEKMTELMEKNREICLLCSEFEPFVSSFNALNIPDWEKRQFKGDNSLEHLKFSPHHLFIDYQGCSMCIRRSFWEQVKDWWYTGWAHDEFLWKLALCLDGLYVYHGITLRRRLHSDNVSLGKMRDLKKRIKFMEDLKKSHETTLEFAKQIGMNRSACTLLERNVKATQMRVELMRDKRIFLTVPLALFYRDCYHSRKSLLVEPYMAIKGE